MSEETDYISVTDTSQQIVMINDTNIFKTHNYLFLLISIYLNMLISSYNICYIFLNVSWTFCMNIFVQINTYVANFRKSLIIKHIIGAIFITCLCASCWLTLVYNMKRALYTWDRAYTHIYTHTYTCMYKSKILTTFLRQLIHFLVFSFGAA